MTKSSIRLPEQCVITIVLGYPALGWIIMLAPPPNEKASLVRIILQRNVGISGPCPCSLYCPFDRHSESAHVFSYIYRNSGLDLVLTVNPFVSTSSRHFQTADHEGYFVVERNSTSGIPALTRFKVNQNSNLPDKFLFISEPDVNF